MQTGRRDKFATSAGGGALAMLTDRQRSAFLNLSSKFNLPSKPGGMGELMGTSNHKSGRPTRRFYLGASALALAAGLSGAAHGQTAQAPAAAAVGEVVVTGTRIEGLDAQSANPISVIGNLQ